jgi:hypothetical protein
MVVDVRPAAAWEPSIIFSSAWATEVRLTAPTAARPNVHLLNFIFGSSVCVFMFVLYLFDTLHCGKKTVFPWHHRGAFAGLIWKSCVFDNKFFQFEKVGQRLFRLGATTSRGRHPDFHQVQCPPHNSTTKPIRTPVGIGVAFPKGTTPVL